MLNDKQFLLACLMHDFGKFVKLINEKSCNKDSVKLESNFSVYNDKKIDSSHGFLLMDILLKGKFKVEEGDYLKTESKVKLEDSNFIINYCNRFKLNILQGNNIGNCFNLNSCLGKEHSLKELRECEKLAKDLINFLETKKDIRSDIEDFLKALKKISKNISCKKEKLKKEQDKWLYLKRGLENLNKLLNSLVYSTNDIDKLKIAIVGAHHHQEELCKIDKKNNKLVGILYHLNEFIDEVKEKTPFSLNENFVKKLLVYNFILTIADNYSATQRTEDLFNEKYDWLNNIFEKAWEWILDRYKCSYKSKFEGFDLENENGGNDKFSLVEDGIKDFIDIFSEDENDDNLFKKVYNWYLKYTYFITDDKGSSLGDISLFEHSKIVTAVANIIYNELKNFSKDGYLSVENGDNNLKFKDFENFEVNFGGKSIKVGNIPENEAREMIFSPGGNKKDDNKKDEYKPSVIAGEFYSIQNYILDTLKSNEKASKRLRGKSLLVRILEEIIIEYILKRLNLTRASVLIQSGGKFFILADQIDDKKFKLLKDEIYKALLEHFKGKINFVLAKFDDYALSDIIGKNEEKIAKKINPYFKFAEMISSLREQRTDFEKYKLKNLEKILNDSQKGKLYKCKGCLKDFTDDENGFCEVCKLEKKIGEKIVKSDKVYVDEFNFLKKFKENLDKDLKVSFKINAIDLKQGFYPKWINIQVPIKTENLETKVKTFEEILEDSDWKYLRVVKGDIDFLGQTIQYGLLTEEVGNKVPRSWWKVSRLMTFSNLLEWFWGKYLLDEIQKNGLGDYVYTVYAGGDDFAFIVHPRYLIKFLDVLYESFKEFVGKNKFLHFSLGISTIYHKTPIRYGIQWADENLSKAKSELRDKFKKVADIRDLKKIMNKSNWAWQDVVLPDDESLKILKFMGIATKQNQIEIFKENSSFVYKIFMLLKKLKYEKDKIEKQKIIADIVYNLGRFKQRTNNENLVILQTMLEDYILDAKIIGKIDYLYVLWQEMLFYIRSLPKEN